MKNIAVIKKIQCVAFNKERAIPNADANNEIELSEIESAQSSDWEEILYKIYSANFSESEKSTSAGSVWSKLLNCTIAKPSPPVAALLKKYERRPLVILATDVNDITHLIYPVRMTRSKNNPGKPGELNRYDIKFKGEWNTEAPFVRMNA